MTGQTNDVSELSAEAVNEYVSVRIGDQLFGAPVNAIREVFTPQSVTEVPRAPSEVAGLLNLRGRIVTAIDARRQSEAAVWGTMPETLYDKSLLLLTRMDRILSDRDRARVVKRVQSETKGMFREVLPVSLIQALEAKGDAEAWAASGADHLVKSLMDLTDEVASGTIGRRVSRMVKPADEPAQGGLDGAIGERVVERPARIVMPTRVRPRPLVSRPPNRP